MYLFPGIGLGTLLSGAHLISDGMLQAAAECLASYMTDEYIQKGILYPSIKRWVNCFHGHYFKPFHFNCFLLLLCCCKLMVIYC
ncbi:NAD-dependent malic enzyme 2, mitochondrial-like [Humulus lupulus]|uniref:NAD-dependent malic enzyme 2, mitochondrial-like n=1 Tax=Humulus lupulus TaxID=3486 RepID=UPI002B4050F9|nr:NAD-dependent malic enzyme 2, mitochondrial-like [Humulus lupulus]